VLVDAPNALAWRTIPSVRYRDSSKWQLALECVDDGTRIVQTYEVLWASPVLSRLYAILVPSHRCRSSELSDDLRRLGELAAADGDRRSITAKSGPVSGTVER
jgi:hypothetical protein